MALMSCPECGKEISDAAQACPHCGHPIQEPQPQDAQAGEAAGFRAVTLAGDRSLLDAVKGMGL